MNTPRTAVTNVSRVRSALRPRRGTPVLASTTTLPAPVAVPRPRRVEVHVPAPAPASPWMPSAPCSPQSCVEAVASAAAVPRAVLRFAAVLTLMVAGLALFPVVRRIPVAPRERAVRTWCRTVVRATGVRVRITGAAPPYGGLLMVANHVSWLDIPLLAAVRPGRMLAKSDIRQWPVAGALTALSGALFIDRNRLRALPDTVARIADGLRGGSAVVVFPEGSTWCGRAQGRFRRAAFQAALDAAAPVQPVRLHYRYDSGPASTAPAFVGSDSLLTSVWRVLTARDLVAEVRVMPVLAPGGAPDRRALALAAQRAVGIPERAPPDPHAHL
ncbi:1-acyl-sn-glycerol-3-phosphate acyltransferase [Streptomyces sp. Y2F8-2]|nr:1-acyl-sn-glycerol-3-phosphate acyltransferase [Streptomyces sp. Y2F8-2]GHK04917.1 1-acyl-sn-glycerol-3-phosphate acyltransferase [Streptomyces sp. Y2F8-2]